MSATDRETDLKLYGDKTLRNQDLVLKIYAVHVTSQSLLSPARALYLEALILEAHELKYFWRVYKIRSKGRPGSGNLQPPKTFSRR
ncbi:hypothetical protein C2857_003248 [Epichloe festucae Fl1]|uniref:Uncharacterized protein n=1 Tax=Epichloe festucae (strain Fl1) TaxID=877507 RepID=A0A7S9PWY4_EPIFF|nr:hypothetical protein C2857_003248 [Epichloe festucae Fl1]